MNTLLAGLCNLCDDFGHTNFDTMCELVHEIANLGGGESNSFDPTSLAKQLRDYQTFLKRKYSKLVERHSTCLELCLTHDSVNLGFTNFSCLPFFWSPKKTCILTAISFNSLFNCQPPQVTNYHSFIGYFSTHFLVRSCYSNYEV